MNLQEQLLFDAVREGNLSQVQTLVEAGANVNARDNREQTPLHWAAKNDDLAVVQWLVQAGADINSEDWYSETPLDKALKPRILNSFSADPANKEIARYLKEVKEEREQKRLRENFLFFALGQHKKAGEGSPVQMLLPDVVGIIHDFLKPEVAEKRKRQNIGP